MMSPVSEPNPCLVGDRDLLRVTEEQLFSPAEVFHENSKIHLADIDFAARVLQVGSSREIRAVVSRPDSGYPGHDRVILPRPGTPRSLDFSELLRQRRSCRVFRSDPVTLPDLGEWLWQGDGVVARQTHEDGTTWSLRTAPSAGGLYPVDQFCLVFNVEGLAPGLYYHEPREHHLERVRAGDFRAEFARATHLGEAAQRAAVCTVLVGVLPRIAFKYGQRGYRFLLLEAGHVAQNLLLGAAALGWGGLAVGGYADDPLNALLGLDGVSEFAVYGVLAGLPA